MIALLGNLSRDLRSGEPPRTGGAPYHAARALKHAGAHAVLYARCAEQDRAELMPSFVALGSPAHYVPGARTASFEIAYEDEGRLLAVRSAGDIWLLDDLPELPDAVRWVHAAPLLRGDFPPETLAALARGRRLSLDGQGLVRPRRTGPLELNADFDLDLLRHVWVLKLAEEEAALLGDPAALGVREVLVTAGASGATVYADGRAEHVPAFEIETDDATGAGDALCISYLAAREAGFAPVAATRRATAVVASMLAE